MKTFGTQPASGYNRVARTSHRLGGIPTNRLRWQTWEKVVTDSTTFWVGQLKAGNREAAQEIWNRYYWRLVGLARKRLMGRGVRAAVDENDIAQSAFASFYRAAEQGRFPQLDDRNDLWRLLIVIAQRKISYRLRQQNCRKRRPNGNNAGDRLEAIDLDEIAGNEPTPEFCAVAI